MALGSFAFAIIPCMESSLVRILALCGIFTVAAMVALAFGRWIADGLDAAFAKWRMLGFLGRIVTVAVVVVATVEAQKGEVMSGEIVVGDSCRGRMEGENSALQLITTTHSLASVKTNASYSYEMPSGAVRYPNWWMRGGYEDVFSLNFGDWSFPLGTASISFDIECTGHGESASEDDIVVNATFTENETGEILATENRMTVVRVDFMPELQAEKNHCIKRHKVGVQEKIKCT